MHHANSVLYVKENRNARPRFRIEFANFANVLQDVPAEVLLH